MIKSVAVGPAFDDKLRISNPVTVRAADISDASPVVRPVPKDTLTASEVPVAVASASVTPATSPLKLTFAACVAVMAVIVDAAVTCKAVRLVINDMAYTPATLNVSKPVYLAASVAVFAWPTFDPSTNTSDVPAPAATEPVVRTAPVTYVSLPEPNVVTAVTSELPVNVRLPVAVPATTVVKPVSTAAVSLVAPTPVMVKDAAALLVDTPAIVVLPAELIVTAVAPADVITPVSANAELTTNEVPVMAAVMVPITFVAPVVLITVERTPPPVNTIALVPFELVTVNS